jgi:hypothetical protein
MSKAKYGIGDIVHDSLLNKNYLVYGLGWKKASTRAYKLHCFETGKDSLFTIYNMDRFYHISKVA